MFRAHFLAASLLLLPIPVQAASNGDPNRELIEYFLQNANPGEMRDMIEALDSVLGSQSMLITGGAANIPHTKYPVNSHNPPCGNGDKPASAAIHDALEKGSEFLLLASSYGGPYAPIAQAVGVAIGVAAVILQQNPQQSFANCSLACTPVPGSYEASSLAQIATIDYIYNRGDEASIPKPISPGDTSDWFVAEDWVASQTNVKIVASDEVYKDMKIIVGGELKAPKGAEISCPVTLVCSRVKNWSHTFARHLQINVTLSRHDMTDGSCIDASLVNENKYSDPFIKYIPQHIKDEYSHQDNGH